MKNSFNFFGLILFTAIVSQNAFSQTKYSHQFERNFKTNKIENSSCLEKINNEEFISAIAKIDIETFSKNTLEEHNIILRSQVKDIVTLFIPKSVILSKTSIIGIKYIDMPRSLSPSLAKVVKDTRVDSVHAGLNLPEAFSGKDVIIGITDWGFDYTHPMFYDTLLQETRILKAWDQFRQIGPSPEGYTYGTEISGSFDLLQFQCDTANQYDYGTHGTHVAGIAGGSGAGTKFRGMAYDANFLFTTIQVNEAAAIDGIVWLKQNAENLGKRLVVNMSWGLYWVGTLDGNAYISQVIDNLSEEGVVFVSSAGNNGNETFHIKKEFGVDDTLKTLVNFNNYGYYPMMTGQALTMWGEEEKPFAFSIKVMDSNFDIIDETPFFDTEETESGFYEDYIVIDEDTIFYNFIIEGSNEFNHRSHAHMIINNKQNISHKIALFLTSENSIVHVWNVIELSSGGGNWGAPLSAPKDGWTEGDGNYSISEPASARSAITVAAHSSETIIPSTGAMGGGTLANFSSRGPTLDERVKPDISAPGVSVASSISSFTTVGYGSYEVVETVHFQDRDYVFLKYSGTSMSGPAAAGVVALMLQANPHLTPQEVKQILIETAREDIKTGTLPEEGSNDWGHGKVTANAAIKKALEMQNIDYFQKIDKCLVYPNPAKDIIHLIADADFNVKSLEIFTYDGKRVIHENISNNYYNVSSLKDGFYIVKITSTNNRVVSQKLVIRK